MLFEAATTEPPFNAYVEEEGTGSWTGTTPESVTAADLELEDYEQLARRAAPVGAHRRVPEAFADAVARCLDPDPAARPTLADLTATLRSLT